MSVHEGDSFVADRTAAGPAADFLPGDTPVLHQSLEGQVVVSACAVARASAVLEQDHLIGVVAQTEITHTHLFSLQAAVAAAPALLAAPPPDFGLTSVRSGALPSAPNLLFLHQWPLFCKKTRDDKIPRRPPVRRE